MKRHEFTACNTHLFSFDADNFLFRSKIDNAWICISGVDIFDSL